MKTSPATLLCAGIASQDLQKGTSIAYASCNRAHNMGAGLAKDTICLPGIVEAALFHQSPPAIPSDAPQYSQSKNGFQPLHKDVNTSRDANSLGRWREAH